MKWQALQLSKTFDGWLAATQNVQRQRRVMLRATQRILHMRLSTIWNSWTSCIAEIHTNRAIIREVVRRLAHTWTWSAWKKLVYFPRNHDAEAELQGKQSKTMRLIVAAMCRQKTCLSLRRWKHVTDRTHAVRCRIIRAMRARSSYATTLCFGRWRHLVQRRKAARRAMTRIMTWNSVRTKMRAFRVWHRTASGITAGAKSGQSRDVSLARVRARWLRLRTSRAMNAWVDFCHTRQWQRSVAGRCINHMLKRKVAAYFETWQRTTKRIEKQRKIMTTFLERWRRRKTLAAIRTWHIAVKEAGWYVFLGGVKGGYGDGACGRFVVCELLG